MSSEEICSNIIDALKPLSLIRRIEDRGYVIMFFGDGTKATHVMVNKDKQLGMGVRVEL